jgi:hypothetical protein
VTLPEDVLKALREVDVDLGRAIVRLTEGDRRPRARRVRPAELASYGNHAVIVVNPAHALKRLPGVQLVPIGDGRALISLDQQSSIPRLELAVRDTLENVRVNGSERQTLAAIVEILQQARRSRGVTLAERTIIVLEAARRKKG